jgi:hypothetical protein
MTESGGSEMTVDAGCPCHAMSVVAVNCVPSSE